MHGNITEVGEEPSILSAVIITYGLLACRGRQRGRNRERRGEERRGERERERERERETLRVKHLERNRSRQLY